MKKAFSLSITLWISMVLMSIAAYILYISKKELNNDKFILQKLNFFIDTHNMMEKMIFYLGTGKFTYNYVENNFLNFPNKIYVDNIVYNFNDTFIKIEDISGKLNIVSVNKNILKRVLKDKNISINPLYLIDTYQDWIDRDNYVRQYGAEKEWYMSHGYNYIPRNYKIFAKDEIYDIKNWKKIFNKVNNLFTFNYEIGYNYTCMDANTLYYKYGIDKEIASKLEKLRNKNINEFLKIFKSIKKENFDYESDTFFPSKILKITVWKKNKKVKYKLINLINFRTYEIETIDY
jgi:hypothetical protein